LPGAERRQVTVRLTEVHVLGQKRRLEKVEITAISAFSAKKARTAAKVKYLSKWCSNPLALTIYVNANELRFSPNDGQPFAPLLCINAGRSFHLRGQEICVCRNGWVIFS
jgi:hypothetical protein